MSRNCLRTIAAAMAGSALLACLPISVRAETQAFDSEASAAAAGWVGVHNREAPIGTDFGWSNTALAVGASGAGEAGGYFPRNILPVGYYADTTIGTVSLNQPLTATGRMVFFTENLDGGLRFGWFNKDQLDAAAPATASISFAEGNRFQSSVRLNSGGGLSSSLVTGGVGPTAADFIINWDPTTKVLTATIGGVTAMAPALSDAQMVTGATMNAFGLFTGAAGSDIPSSRGRLYVDDLSYSIGVPEPMALALLLLGAPFGLALRRRKEA